MSQPSIESRTSFSLSPSSPYGTWGGNGVNRSASRRSYNSFGTSVDRIGANKRTSLRGFGNYLATGNGADNGVGLPLGGHRPGSPSPSVGTSLNFDVSLDLLVYK
jgi:hypothetical protein